MTGTVTAQPAIADMLRGYSIEVDPREGKAVDAAIRRLDRGTDVFLT